MSVARRLGCVLVAFTLFSALLAGARGEAGISITSVTVAEPDPASVPRHAKIELLVTLADVAATKFYDPDPSQVGLDLSATFNGPGGARAINGFYDGAAWRIRFAPTAAGDWTFSVTATDSSGTATWTGGSFTCVASAYPGFARIDGHYLRFTEGKALFAVGHNTGWQGDVEQPALPDMAAQGENLLSFWLAMPWAQPSWASPEEPEWDDRAPIENTEQGIGNYNQAACAYLDGVVARAEAANVYLLPTLWSHGQLRDVGHPWGTGWWANNAYSALCSATDFFKTANGSETPQWRYQKNFYRYVLARWGYSRAIAGWVGLCEIEGTTGYVNNKAQAQAWCTAVRNYFSANDPYRVNASAACPIVFTKTDWSSDWNSWTAAFDLRATDSYVSQTSNVAVANTIATETRTMWASGMPCFHTEFGGDTKNGATQPTHLHNGLWPGTTAGAAMTPLLWCDGGNFPLLSAAMQNHLQYLSQFMAGIEYVGDPNLAVASLSIASPCRGWGMSLANRGFVWIQNTSGTIGGQQLTLSAVTPGLYRVLWYDAWTSGATAIRASGVTVAADGLLKVTTPTLARADIALKFFPNSGPIAINDSYSTSEDTPLAVAAPGVLANDTDPNGDPLTATKVSGPSHGTLTLNADGSFAYTPAANFSGSDSFTYKANDGTADSDTATVTIAVGAVNDPPIANDNTATTPQSTPVTIAVLANDTDPDGDTLSVASVTQGAHGSVTTNGTTVTYTPTNGYTGADTFTYTASDGKGGTDVATVTVTVTASTRPDVYGWITDSSTGSGINGISVKLTRKNGYNWVTVATTTTDAQGYYTFTRLTVGTTYRVTPSNPKWTFTPSYRQFTIATSSDHVLASFTGKRK